MSSSALRVVVEATAALSPEDPDVSDVIVQIVTKLHIFSYHAILPRV